MEQVGVSPHVDRGGLDDLTVLKVLTSWITEVAGTDLIWPQAEGILFVEWVIVCVREDGQRL